MNKTQYQQLRDSLGKNTTLVAVSKMKNADEIKHLYRHGHRDFGENYVQELIEKQLLLPNDIRWHFIGHLQSNKIRYLVPFIHLIQSVDSFKLLAEINRQAKKIDKVVNCLLQIHISGEETKFGLNPAELDELINGLANAEVIHEFNNVRICGLMGIASYSDDMTKLRAEMRMLAALYDKYAVMHTPHIEFTTLSMGMSADYQMAIEEGGNMVRIGSLIFGSRG
jgi:pyridoxal phosphate enzyme (YggS family)